MALNRLTLETDGLVIGTNQLIASGGGITIGQNLVTLGNTYTGNLSVSGSISSTVGPVIVSANLTLQNAVTASGTLSVTGNAGFASNINVTGAGKIYQNGVLTPTLVQMLTYNLAF